jgi:hypothetical protein
VIKEHISHYEEEKYATEESKLLLLSQRPKNHLVTSTTVYCPPIHLLKKIKYIEFLKQQGKRFIVGGDFNAKNTHWGSRLTTAKGRQLLEAASEYGCKFVSTGKPTYWPTDLLTFS